MLKRPDRFMGVTSGVARDVELRRHFTWGAVEERFDPQWMRPSLDSVFSRHSPLPEAVVRFADRASPEVIPLSKALGPQGDAILDLFDRVHNLSRSDVKRLLAGTQDAYWIAEMTAQRGPDEPLTDEDFVAVADDLTARGRGTQLDSGAGGPPGRPRPIESQRLAIAANSPGLQLARQGNGHTLDDRRGREAALVVSMGVAVHEALARAGTDPNTKAHWAVRQDSVNEPAGLLSVETAGKILFSNASTAMLLADRCDLQGRAGVSPDCLAALLLPATRTLPNWDPAAEFSSETRELVRSCLADMDHVIEKPVFGLAL
jgi:hypothetical protein